MAAIYSPRVKPAVEAVRWTGDNAAEVQALLDKAKDQPLLDVQGGTIGFYSSDGCDVETAEVGDWVILYLANKRLNTMADEGFNDTYMLYEEGS